LINSEMSSDGKLKSIDLFAQLHKDLVEHHGKETADAILWTMAGHMGGERVTVPSRETLYREIRDTQIRKLYKEGFTRSVLCERFSICMSTVERVLPQQPRFGGESED